MRGSAEAVDKLVFLISPAQIIGAFWNPAQQIHSAHLMHHSKRGVDEGIEIAQDDRDTWAEIFTHLNGPIWACFEQVYWPLRAGTHTRSLPYECALRRSYRRDDSYLWADSRLSLDFVACCIRGEISPFGPSACFPLFIRSIHISRIIAALAVLFLLCFFLFPAWLHVTALLLTVFY